MTDEATAAAGGASKGIPGWLIAVLVLSGLAVIVFCAALFGAASILVPRIQEKQRQSTCANNLRRLGGLYVADAMRQDGAPGEGGARYFLRLVHDASADPAVLFCPSDSVATPETVVAGADGGRSPSAADALRRVCSYAVRDFARYPLDDSATDEFVAADAADVHGRGGVTILLSDGSVQFRTRAGLGLAPDEPIVIGPDSSHPELAKLCIVPAR